MSNSEFDIIKEYFSFPSNRDDVVLAGGDDCAIVTVPKGKQLLVTTDTLISGVHFPEKTSAEDIAYKAIMVNLSDLAAMGATPAWLTLAISLPEINEDWLRKFSTQMKTLLSDFNVSLIGGDTTRGDLSITVQAMGCCDKNEVLRRDQAKVGDKIFVTGYLGDAAIGLLSVLNNISDDALLSCIYRLNRPEARIKFAQALGCYSKCAIDISDGLVADLGHVLSSSCCGAEIDFLEIPLSESAKHYFKNYNKDVVDWRLVLAHGDDYELCFTVNDENISSVEALANRYNINLSCIGEITGGEQLSFINTENQLFDFSDKGFSHF